MSKSVVEFPHDVKEELLSHHATWFQQVRLASLVTNNDAALQLVRETSTEYARHVYDICNVTNTYTACVLPKVRRHFRNKWEVCLFICDVIDLQYDLIVYLLRILQQAPKSKFSSKSKRKQKSGWGESKSSGESKTCDSDKTKSRRKYVSSGKSKRKSTSSKPLVYVQHCKSRTAIKEIVTQCQC